MESVTLRVRSIVWFVTGATLATAITLMFANAWSVDAAPGDTDSTFVPMTPCRLADTRPEPNRVGGDGRLSANSTITFQATGTNGDCTISTDAVGLSLNVTALGATTLGDFLTIWPGGERPLAASLNPAPGEPPTPNAVTTPLSESGSFNVYNFVGGVDVTIDVVGYYTKASLRELASRLAAVEASTSALESATAANSSDIDAAEASIAQHSTAIESNAADVSTNAAGVSGLDAAQPFAVGNRSDEESVASGGAVVVSIIVTAPVAGQVTVNSTTDITENTAGDAVLCSITTGSVIDADYLQRWESAGQDGDSTQMAGSRVFDLAAGASATYNLFCRHIDIVGNSFLQDSVLTAIFTPAP